MHLFFARVDLEALVVMLLAVVLLSARADAQQRQDVTFQISYNQTVVGQSVFIVGDLPELGSGDIRKAVKLVPAPWPTWSVTIAIPVNTSYSYRFIRRDDAPARQSDASNQVAIGSVINASTNTVSMSPARKAIVYHSGFQPPVLYWRTVGNIGSTTAYTRVEMTPIGPGRNAQEKRWIALDIGAGGKPIEFYFTSPSGTSRDPANGTTYVNSLDAMFVQDGNVYSYVPAASVSSWKADYTPTNNQTAPPGFASTNLSSEFRRHRVILPRGYAEHSTRRYPVIYFHDGQNMFDYVSGTFGTWNAHTTAAELTRLGQMRECILVGADNSSTNRLSDYSAPDSGGWANRYAAYLINELKPRIDAGYRTLPGVNDTTTIGSSMGGQVSLYLGWDYTSVFSRIGAFSGAWNVFTSGFLNRVQASTTRRNIRLYLDSGTQSAGSSADNFWATLALRDDLLTTLGASNYVLERDLKHVIGLDQDHNEAAWASRLPDALRFLVPATEDANALLPLTTSSFFDVNGDTLVNIEDLYHQALGGTPGSPARDLNFDGSVDESDTMMLEWYIRRNEAAAMATGR